ncbi:MAG: arylesterase [Gammaproteobacteria bacterium]|nr:arylesterase [Gammaproteobacteria bacterium]MDP6617391.1 arylesterase [Gammaproteobacteria bacterium]MDP6694638.1 arylesterase [Gammaproteobacteria bacterium]
MLRNSTVSVVCLLLVSLSGLAAGAKASETSPTLLIIGDSLSAGLGLDQQDTWVTLLQKQLDQKGYGYRVVNASISGDTTGNGLRRLPRALDIHQPDIVLIELGGNDGLRGLPVDLMRSNLDQMIRKSAARDAMVILAGMMIPPNYGEDYATEFATVYPSLADEHSLPLIPFFMEGIAFNPGMFQADRIHPNKKAQPILLDNVWEVLGPALSE